MTIGPQPRLGRRRRVAARRGARRLPGGLALLLLALWVGSPAPAQEAERTAPEAAVPEVEPVAPGAEVTLTPAVEQNLLQLQEQWSQWMGAFYTSRPDRAEGVLDRLLTSLDQLGLERLPDLSRAAAARAVDAATRGDFPRAHWALEAAERLDPERPETAFARAQVLRREDRLVAALGSELVGFTRLAEVAIGRATAIANLTVWILGGLLLAGAIFVVLEMLIRGGGLLADVERFLGFLPAPVARGLAVVALLSPLALPQGVWWLLLVWSVLLWGYAPVSERGVLIFVWLVLALTPLVVDRQQQRVRVALTPAVRALDGLSEGRLYGDLFSDLEVVVSRLPDEPGVVHMLADFHRDLGQWDLARRLYREVVVLDPDNPWALLDLGAYYYFNRDYGTAIHYFERATEADPDNVGAWYNLSRAYYESYLFDEAQDALAEAQGLDEARVSRFMKTTGENQILTFSGGLDRIPELRRQLALQRLPERNGGPAVAEPAAPQAPEAGASPPLAISPLAFAGLLLAAVGLHLMRRSKGYSRGPSALVVGVSLWRRVLLPGVDSLEGGEGVKAYCALLVPALCLALPAVESLGFPWPLPFTAAQMAPVTVAMGGLLAYLAVRLWWLLRQD